MNRLRIQQGRHSTGQAFNRASISRGRQDRVDIRKDQFKTLCETPLGHEISELISAQKGFHIDPDAITIGPPAAR
jgi:hypothetical protein